MKRVILTIVAVFYLFTATGATVYNHYCMGDLVNVGTSQQDDKPCDNCGMEKSPATDNGCCSETLQFSESANDEHIIKASSLNIAQPVAILSFIFIITQQSGFSAVKSLLPPAHTFMPGEKLSISILHCTFRI